MRLQKIRLKRGQARLWRSKIKFNRILVAKLAGMFVCLFVIAYCSFSIQSEATRVASDFVVKIQQMSQEAKQTHIFYVMNGGVNAKKNPSYIDGAKQDKFWVHTPYRCGYRFQGWYLEPRFYTRVRQIVVKEQKSLILYAKWTPIVDNAASVVNYHYSSNPKRKSKEIRLIDCIYGFYEEIDIPGMPKTREMDFLNKLIFSVSQYPQGLCMTDEFVLLTSYSEEEDCKGELMVFDKESGDCLCVLGMDEKSHLGGIAFDGSNVWVCNSSNNTLERISYDFIQHMAQKNTNGVVDATDVVDIYKVSNTPSCITYYGGRLWIATHNRFLNSKVVAYHLNTTTDKLEALNKYEIPEKVQGIVFDEEGAVYLSTSFGRTNSSYLKKYASIVDLASYPNRPMVQVEMPPCSEEIDIRDGSIYVLFESAGEKYLEGTDGRGESLSPLDKILIIDMSTIVPRRHYTHK